MTTALWILIWITKQNINVGDVPRLYGIKGFEDALHGYISTRESDETAGFQNIYLWNTIKMQCFSQQDQDIVYHHKLYKHYSLPQKVTMAWCSSLKNQLKFSLLSLILCIYYKTMVLIFFLRGVVVGASHAVACLCSVESSMDKYKSRIQK